MRTPRPRRALVLLAGLALGVAACGDDDDTGSDVAEEAADTAPSADAASDTGAAGGTDSDSTGDATDATGTGGTGGTESDPTDADDDGTTDDAGGTDSDSTDVDVDLDVGTGAAGTESVPDGGDSAAEDLRIVSLSPTHTEMLFAIGAGDQLVAVDDQSDFPAEVAELPDDLSGFEPNVEAIASYEPDLVVIGGDFTGLADQLASLDIETYDGPAAETFEDTYTQIQDLGDLTGREDEATELVERMQADIDEIVAGTTAPDDELEYYHEINPTLFSVTSDTFLGEVYGLFGMTSIADDLEADAGAFPQLTAEFVVDEDPDVIFVDDCCGETSESVAERPGWGEIDAVADGDVFQVDDDLASRWGPRLVDYVAVVSDVVGSVS